MLLSIYASEFWMYVLPVLWLCKTGVQYHGLVHGRLWRARVYVTSFIMDHVLILHSIGHMFLRTAVLHTKITDKYHPMVRLCGSPTGAEPSFVSHPYPCAVDLLELFQIEALVQKMWLD